VPERGGGARSVRVPAQKRQSVSRAYERECFILERHAALARAMPCEICRAQRVAAIDKI